MHRKCIFGLIAASLVMLLTPSLAFAEIPDWVKTNAEWWTDGQIDDASFTDALEYLINVGVITVAQCPDIPAAGTSGGMFDTFKSDDMPGQVTDVTPPTVTPPEDMYVGATATLTALPQLGAARAVDDVDGSLAVTNDAPDMFPIGRTTITWNATDESGNWATATQIVTVHADDLDPSWYYTLTWEPGGGGHAAIGATKQFDSLLLYPSDVGDGEIHLFKTFRTADIIGRSIAIKSDTSTPHNVVVYVVDGTYSKGGLSGFAPAAEPISKGGGILAAYAISEMPGSFKPDWARSQLDETTLVISLEKKVAGWPFAIHSVEFEGHSKWIFDDYKVNQAYNGGTYVLLPIRAPTYDLPVSDTFESSLDGWTYRGDTTNYILGYDAMAGNPQPSAFISMDQFVAFSGMGKTIDISGVPDGHRLTISYDYRASSGTSESTVTRSTLYVLDADTGDVLLREDPAAGGTVDTGWQSHNADLTDETAGSDRIEIVLGFHDSWIAKWDQRNWYDNVAVYAAPPTYPADDYSPIIHIFHPKPNQFMAENTDSSQGGPGVKIWPNYIAKRHDGTDIPNQSLDIVFTMHGPEPDHVVHGFHPAYHRGPSEYGQTTLTISYTDTVNGKDYTTTESVTFYMGSTKR